MNEIQIFDKEKAVLRLDEIKTMGDIFHQSKFFTGIQDAAQAMVKIMYGQELGLGPVESMQNIHIIPGQGGPKIQVSSHLMAAKIKQSGKYDYRIVKSNDVICEIEFLNTLNGSIIGSYAFTIEMARRAGLTKKQNWLSYPNDMLFNRAISGGAKRYCPDIFSIAVYTEADGLESEAQEIATITESSEVIGAASQGVRSIISNAAKASETKKNGETKPQTNEKAIETTDSTQNITPPSQPITETKKNGSAKDKRPLSAVQLKTGFTKSCNKYSEKEAALYTIIENTKEHLDYALGLISSGAVDVVEKVLYYLTDSTSSTKLREYHALALLDWIGYKFHINNTKVDGYWLPADEVYQEVDHLLKEYESGNAVLPIEQSDSEFADALFGEN